MFGNRLERRGARPAFGFLETLGFLTADPRAAWAEIAQPSHLGAGALATLLAVTGKALVSPLPWEGGSRALLFGFSQAVTNGLLLWLAPSLLLHVLSALFRRRGSLSAFLAATGWAGVVLWAALPLRLLGDAYPAASLLTGLPRLALTIGYIALWWVSLRRVYGWTKGGAFLLLAGLLPVVALVAGASGLATVLFALKDGSLLKSFLP